MTTYANTAGASGTAGPSGAGMAGGAAGPLGSAGAANPYAQPPALPVVKTSPGLAFILGWIPGVGAIYNGQYLKGLVHAAMFGLLITALNSGGGEPAPFLVMIMVGLVFYMPFEAYHTAKKRQAGVAVDEWSSLIPRNSYSSRLPVGPVILILLGVLFLLDSLHVLEFRDIGRFWPVLLIVIGAYMLYARVTRPAMIEPPPPPAYQQGQAYQAPAYQPIAYQAAAYETPVSPTPPATPPSSGGSMGVGHEQ